MMKILIGLRPQMPTRKDTLKYMHKEKVLLTMKLQGINSLVSMLREMSFHLIGFKGEWQNELQGK